MQDLFVSQGVVLSAGANSITSGTAVASNGGGVTFGVTGQTLTATVATNYLTTAMASNRGTDFVQATAVFAGTSASGTIASGGLSVSIGPYITTQDRKSTRLNSSHIQKSRMPSSA